MTALLREDEAGMDSVDSFGESEGDENSDEDESDTDGDDDDDGSLAADVVAA